MSYEATGALRVINDQQTFASGFAKREFVIETDEKYPQKLKFELVKDKCGEIDRHELGDVLTVHFNLRGNEHNGRYFVNLHAWKIEATGERMEEARDVPASEARIRSAGQNPPNPTQPDDDCDDVPF